MIKHDPRVNSCPTSCQFQSNVGCVLTRSWKRHDCTEHVFPTLRRNQDTKSKVKNYSHNFRTEQTKNPSTCFLQALVVGLITLTNPCLLSFVAAQSHCHIVQLSLFLVIVTPKSQFDCYHLSD
jgi:hypothetical protein